MTTITRPPRPATAGVRDVLLVDDDPFMRHFVADMLRRLGVRRVETATDGRNGCEVFDRLDGRLDLVVCDINMPDTDGFQFMGQLAERGFKGGVVLLSGLDSRTRTSAAPVDSTR